MVLKIEDTLSPKPWYHSESGENGQTPGTVKANTNHAKIISQVAARSMADPNYTTLAAPPELKRSNSQAAATKRRHLNP